MKRALIALALSFFGASAVLAQTPAPIPDTPLPSEVAFVQSATKDLNARFSNPAAAEKAGYFRYNNEDKTGAISYANLKWNSVDPRHPSQLWYDVKGRLLGADFSRMLTMPAVPPNIWGLNTKRWFKFKSSHVHWVLKNPDGTMSYGLAARAKDFLAAGGSLSNPQAATLVKMGKVKDASQVVKVFTFPAQWDTEIWLTPNPNGAFATTNPLVHPSTENAKGEM
jgi:hypothetical protein